MKNINNVKPGDIIVSRIGSAVLLRETRAKWFYLFKGRVNSISKSEFWRMVDTGEMQISYVASKKYRRKQKNYRVFDLTSNDSNDDYMTRLEVFLTLLDPNEFWILTNDWDTSLGNYMDKFSECINDLKHRGYTCEIDRRGSGRLYIKVIKNL